ncbi:MAG: 5' nucleotidase, deoxy (Pyrimidine), cytosolic type C protein (NT5C) [Pelotomaculum sp. PtaU1.Bin035]|nr:MAG: 5' nucleotidase, deoxy (Pyrimidine), cytosolic type C protein (NT5C) [Pelotomaculum sp. PtaU1.Bin035]
MRVGVDIDGVLADSLPLWVHELNRYFKRNKQVEEVHLFDLINTFEITPSELMAFLEQRGRFLMSGPCPVKGAVYYLSMIKKYHKIFIVTARKEAYKEETQGWLQRYGVPYDKLLLLGSYNKKEACMRNGLDVMVEDTLEVGLEIITAGIPVILMDAPYNRGNLPDLIYRRYSWFEIYQTLVAEPLRLGGTCFGRSKSINRVIPLADSIKM